MKFENTEVWGFGHAIRGMRNPKQSHDRSDSEYTYEYDEGGWCSKDLIVGKNDLKLMQKLIKAGSEHRKFLRQIMVSCDITAPLYWWKEFDTYKVGTVANSTSTMHKLASTPITMDCFEMDDFFPNDEKVWIADMWKENIHRMETLREMYNATKDKRYWKELIRLLPESWLQTRTVTMNYENILSMYSQRRNHKLTEWSVSFIDWVKSLPYAQELIIGAS